MASAQAKHVPSNLLKEQLFRLLCSSSLLSLALDPCIELPIERAFAHLDCVPAPLLIEFITMSMLSFFDAWKLPAYPCRSPVLTSTFSTPPAFWPAQLLLGLST